MKVSNGELIRKIDKYSIEKLGIPSVVLMENAALKVVRNLKIQENNKYVVICGRGNNGGDGFAVARHLISNGKKVSVFSIGLNQMSNDCALNHDILGNMGIKITNITNVEDIEFLRASILRSDVVVDAIFGIGLKREIRGIYNLAINVINGSGKHIVAVDVPSGFMCDTGEIAGNCINAHKTVTFETYKKGFLNYGSHHYTGDVIVEHIGIPEYVVNKYHKKEFFLEDRFIRKSIKERERYSHKGNFGHVLIFAGSKGMTGAAMISTKAAVKTGAGLTSLISCNEAVDALKVFVPEAMWSLYDDREKNKELIQKAECIAFGPGMGGDSKVKEWLKELLKRDDKILVLDADGLNALQGETELLKNSKCKIILTPHPGEMARLCGKSIPHIQKDRIDISKKFAKEHGVILILKGYNSIITDGDVAFINPTGNGSMANGGMGDCLTGMISSLCAQGYSPMKASYISTYIHGKCGDDISEEKLVVNATDIIDNIARVLKKYSSKKQ